VTSVAFGLGGDVIMGDANGRILVWIKDNSDAFVLDRTASDNLRHAHEVRDTRLMLLVYKVKGNRQQSYGASPAIWDHAVFAATRHRRVRPALTLASRRVQSDVTKLN